MSRIGLALALVACWVCAGGAAFGQTPRKSTRSQFEQAVQVAKIAARNGMHALSLRAVRGALEGGPPADVAGLTNIGRAASGGMAATRPPGRAADIERQVLVDLEELDQLWRKTEAPPDDVYVALAAIVLPTQQPGEIALYALPINESGIVYPGSAGRLLAQWAVRAGKVSDLRTRIEVRQEQPLAQAPARVLLAQLARATNDAELAEQSLRWFEQRISADSLGVTAELAVHALPCLRRGALGNTAETLLAAIIRAREKNSPKSTDDHLYAATLLTLARSQLARGDSEAARRQLDKYLALDAGQLSRNADYSAYRRFEQHHAVARELAAGKSPVLAWEYLAPAADLPRTSYGAASIGPTLVELGRQLAERPARERYELLKAWTMPAANRRSVRMIGGFVAPETRPACFLSDTDRDRTARTNGAGENFASSAALLIDAAREAEQLDDLAVAASAAATEKCENGELFSWLVEVSRGAGRTIAPQLRQWIEQRRTNLPPQGDRSRQIPWLDYELARACLADDAMRPVGEEAARMLIAHSQRIQDHLFMSQCRRDLWAGIAARDPAAHLAATESPDLAIWTPASHQTAAIHRGGSASAWWVAHEGHVAHAGGPEHEFLYLNYPLTGKFSFIAEAFEGGFGEGNVSYGGLVFEGLHFGMQTQIWPVGKSEIVYLPDPLESVGAFHRFTIDVKPERTRCYVNGRLLYEDNDPSPTSPWLALFSNRLMQAVFRNVRIEGHPQIPREVRLTHGDRMEGWISGFYGETQPPRRTIGRSDPYGRAPAALNPDLDSYDWHSADGVLFGRRVPRLSRTLLAESRLYYHRPLGNGETISYEFFYKPGEFEVHPALDRLTFLLDPGGVRLHWMTDGSDSDTSGIDPHNIADEPESRRGPESLPLKPGQWNRAKLSLAGDQLALAINDVEVFRRPLQPENDRLFGFFRYRAETAAQVRNVVLSGDWPESLPAAPSLLAVATGEPVDAATRRARHAIVDETYLSQNAWNVWCEARTLPAEAGYAMLADWVLPNEDHPTFRLRGDFTPGDLAPPVAETFLLAGERPDWPRAALGGRLVAPAIELAATAKELGRLPELAKRIAAAQVDDGVQQRGRLAMRVLTALASGNEAEANQYLQQMLPWLRQIDPHAPEHERWPELIAVAAAVESPALRRSAQVLAELMVEQHQQNYVSRDWEQQIRHLRGVARWKAHPDSHAMPIGRDPALKQWTPVTLAAAETRGKGYPPSHWRAANGLVEHVPGHRRDSLYFAVPLRGDFQVEAQLASFGWRETELVYGGVRVAPRSTLKHFGKAYIGWTLPDALVDPPLAPIGSWYDFRLDVRQGTASAYVNGRLLNQERLPPDPDPWLAVFCEGHFDGAVRNVRITGQTTVPEELDLSGAIDLSAWHAGYYNESLTGDSPAWRKTGDEIEGRRLADVEGSFRESLLQYHRPLLEDGQIEYEFYYEPGKIEVHPSLDRLAIVVAPEGAAIHWLTDAQFDRSGLAPDNLSAAPHSAALPLKPAAWNQAKLSLAGDELYLEINGGSAFRRKLEASNQRTFGFFHFADRTEARVRRVRYRGQWPRSLTAPDEQELAVDLVASLALDERKLRRRLSLDLRNAELDPRYFRPTSDAARGFIRTSPEGMRIDLPAERAEPGDAGLATSFGLRGDFEVVAEFEILKATPPPMGYGSGFDLHAQFAGTDDHLIIERRFLAGGVNLINCGRGLRGADGQYQWNVGRFAVDAKAGRHKLTRKDATAYYFFAVGDGPFELFDNQVIGGEDVAFAELLGRGFDKQGGVDLVIKHFQARAEDFPGLPEEKQP